MKNLSLLFIAFLLLQLSSIAQQINHLPNNPYSSESKYSIFSTGVDTAWVRHYASGLLYSNDKAMAVAVDDDGNIYVAGISDVGGSDPLIKYNSIGVEQWIASYNGIDGPTVLAVDGSGNVYVTASNEATIKYNSSGVQQWLVEGGGVDIAVDADGNVYITNTVDDDFVTTKYNSSGVQQWQATYNGMEDWGDFAVALVLDDSANVYVTGSIGYHGWFHNWHSEGIGTVKYNSYGVQQWAVHYTEPSGDYDHIASGIAFDDAGYIYVTGSAKDSITGYDYATIKYNVSGVEQWAVTYNDTGSSNDVPSKLAIDNFGDIYVTGNSGTIKYNSSGIEQWVIEETGIDMIVDQVSNVYLTEQTDENYALYKYNTSGILQWTAFYNGPGNGPDEPTALALDNAGNVCVTGNSDGGATQLDIATIKYNSSGNELWVDRYCETGYSDDYGSAIAIDEDGNSYVTGISIGPGTHQDYATVKYNAGGIQQWVARYDGTGNNSDQGKAIAVDEAGNVYVTGQSMGINYPKSDYITIKYNSSGEEQWIARYNAGDANHEANALAIDGAGNTYVTGRSGPDCATIKYNSDGTEEWVTRYVGSSSAEAIAVDDQGNVYVTGGNTIKYNSSGEEQWAVDYLPGSMGNAIDIAVDGVGNVYVTGFSDGGATDIDIATIKYNSAGEEQWVNRYNGPGNHHDSPSALVIDNAGDIIVAGNSWVGTGGDDYTVIKYDTAGTELWIAYYDTLFEHGDYLTALAIDSADNIYVTGSRVILNPPPIGYDSSNTTVKYNSDGIEQWAVHYKGAAVGTIYRPSGIAVSKSGDVYVTGNSDYDEPGTNFLLNTYTTIKYIEVPVSVDEEQTIVPNAYSLSQNFPNPFNPSTTIYYSIPEVSIVTLRVYDVLGSEIATLVNEEKSIGTYELTWYAESLPSGIYFYRLQAGSFVETKKMILLK